MEKHMLTRVLALIGIPAFVWVFMMYFTPFVMQYCPNWQHYVNHVSDAGITNPGVLYYNDVPVTQEATILFRDTLSFLPHGHSEN